MGVEIYAKDNCMWCSKAKEWFTSHDIPFTVHDTSRVEDFKAMQQRVPGAKTVPQIFIDGNLIGGYDMLSSYQDQILAKLRLTYPAKN